MKQAKLRNFSIFILAVLFALSLAFAFVTWDKRSAYAATYSPTNVFSQGTGGDVRTYKQSEDSENAYTTFVLSNEGKVYYRKNLALKWYEGKNQAGYFNLTLAFGDIHFNTFEILFESPEENITKKAKTTNSLVFTEKEGSLSVSVKNSAEEQSEEKTLTDPNGDIAITLSEGGAGEFKVLVNGEEVGAFTNIGGNYLEYSSTASTTPKTPMTFTAKLKGGETTNDKQKVFLKELNGQTLEVTDGTNGEKEDDNTVPVTGGNIKDDTPAVLVLNEEVYAFRLGQKFSLYYQAIDVLRDSVTVKRYYHVATKNENSQWVKGKFESGGDYKTLTTSTYFMPSKEFEEGEEQEIYISICFELNDGEFNTTAYAQDNKLIYLDWYAADNAVKTLQVFGEDDEEGSEVDYIKANRNKQGPEYVGFAADDETKENVKDNTVSGDTTVYEKAVADYQAAVTEVSKSEDLSAGTGSYFYLPSLRGLITSDYADYRNLKFSIYYYNDTQSAGSSAASATSLSYNALKFEIKTEGSYKFRVLATDAAGNGMKYYLDGELVTVSGSTIWDIDGIPEFTFDVKYTGAKIEDPGEQTLGYRDTVYSVKDFEVIAVSGIDKEYTLYYFNESKLPEGTTMPSYAEFVKNTKYYFENELYRGCFEEIKKFNSEISEDDEEWDESQNAYRWYENSSLSFNPQVSGYYLVELCVTDAALTNRQEWGYQVIEVRNPFDYTPGQSEWLQNNVTSIVLFSISAVLLVVIIVLFVVKPSDKKVEEVDLEKLKGKKKNK